MSITKAVKWVFLWVVLAAGFNLGIYYFLGAQKALEFLGGYIIEFSLSIDNLFVFLMVFAGFGLSPLHQRRVLNFGIFGAVILRLLFIVLGLSLVNKFHWVLYLFSPILIISGIKMFNNKDGAETDFSQNRLVRGLGKIMPITASLHQEKFWVRKQGILHATPLLAVLVLIEGSDLLFAIDSIPAIFAISTDPLIVYSSNIFAILGLRNLYFVLERLHQSFRYVKYGVGLVLIFTGIKLGILLFHIEISLILSIGMIVAIMGLSILFSVLFPDLRENDVMCL